MVAKPPFCEHLPLTWEVTPQVQHWPLPSPGGFFWGVSPSFSSLPTPVALDSPSLPGIIPASQLADPRPFQGSLHTLGARLTSPRAYLAGLAPRGQSWSPPLGPSSVRAGFPSDLASLSFPPLGTVNK